MGPLGLGTGKGWRTLRGGTQSGLVALGRRMLGIGAVIIGVVLGSAAAGLEAPGGAVAEAAPLQVVGTTGMVADLAREVGGDRVNVVGLMGPGIDPHLYKASHGDTRRLARADVVFYNGLHLEGKMIDVLVRMGRQKPTYAVTEYVPEELLREPPEFSGHYDPHVWFDVSLWIYAVDRVRDALAEVDPDGRDYYEARASAYKQRLREIDDYVRRRIGEIPPERRVLVTAHDAFGYFGAAYGMEVVGLQGISTATEYGLRDVQALVDMIVERGIKAVFVEASVAPRAIEAVVSGVRARGHSVTIGGTLYSDSLGEPGTPAGTYIGMVRHNVDTIVAALR